MLSKMVNCKNDRNYCTQVTDELIKKFYGQKHNLPAK